MPFLKERNAFVSPSSLGYVTIYDEQCDDGGLYPNEFAIALSRQLNSLVFLVTVHDDDILYFDVFDNGLRKDKYDSCPNYFSEDDEDFHPPEGGNAQELCTLFGCNDRAVVESVLYTTDEESVIWLFATERHRALAELLHLQSFSVGFGYNYIAQGEVP
ncbi:MAG: hypothetical protein LBU43_05795, partial [Candidatus Accumulibacter sp.]|nr:hypothetical protein [Accumulibacter sp.]